MSACSLEWKALAFLLASFISLTTQAQFRIKVTAKNTADSIVYVRTSVYDDQNYIPKDTISLRKSGWSVSKKAIIGGIGFLYFPKTKAKIGPPKKTSANNRSKPFSKGPNSSRKPFEKKSSSTKKRK